MDATIKTVDSSSNVHTVLPY